MLYIRTHSLLIVYILWKGLTLMSKSTEFKLQCYLAYVCTWEIGSALVEWMGQERWVSYRHKVESTWWPLCLAVEDCWSALGRPFLSFAQIGLENAPHFLGPQVLLQKALLGLDAGSLVKSLTIESLFISGCDKSAQECCKERSRKMVCWKDLSRLIWTPLKLVPPEQIFLKYLDPLWKTCSHYRPVAWKKISDY